MNANILFAEDDPSIRTSFSEILGREGVAVTACASAAEACQHLAADCYDLVITDMRMETPTAGWNVIRAAAALAHPPMLAVMTAFPIPRAELRSYHIDAVLSKGMPTQALMCKMRELIQQAAAHPKRCAPQKDGGHDHAA
jgi:CheY-like chemotaxis protein